MSSDYNKWVKICHKMVVSILRWTMTVAIKDMFIAKRRVPSLYCGEVRRGCILRVSRKDDICHPLSYTRRWQQVYTWSIRDMRSTYDKRLPNFMCNQDDQRDALPEPRAVNAISQNSQSFLSRLINHLFIIRLLPIYASVYLLVPSPPSLITGHLFSSNPRLYRTVSPL